MIGGVHNFKSFEGFSCIKVHGSPPGYQTYAAFQQELNRGGGQARPLADSGARPRSSELGPGHDGLQDRPGGVLEPLQHAGHVRLGMRS
jgi:hypothetical protein